jgi:aspartate oxidase
MTIYRDEMARMSAKQSHLISKVLRGEGVVLHDLEQLCAGLDKLDALAARYDVLPWAEED